jgi:hypothetical protein
VILAWHSATTRCGGRPGRGSIRGGHSADGWRV